SAFLTDAEPETIAALPDGSRFAVQKYLAGQFLDAEDAVIAYAPDGEKGLTLTEADGRTVCQLDDPETDGTISYSLFLNEQQALYFDLFSDVGTALNDPNCDACDILVNGLTVQAGYPENNRNGLLYLGTHEGQVIIRITVHKAFSCESFGVFGMQTERIAEAAQNAKGTVLQYQDGVYTAECDTETPQTVIFSAAYDEGFSAESNGEAAPVYRVNSCQLAVRVPAGHSRIVLRFRVRGLRAGILLGIAGLILAVLFALLRKRLPETLFKLAYRTGEGMLRLSYAVILAAVYILPLGFCLFSPLFV
ncbi:MAG: YfhO family protein, partial [Oscillospiraceae bacterium]|nr:YfhO family protein [Oscillospiraceae bacterium]